MLAVEQAKLSVSPTSGTLPPTAPIDVSAAGRPGVYGIIPVYGSVANAVASFDEGDYLWTGLFTAQLVFLDLTLVSSGYRVAAGGYRFFFTARAVAGLLDDAANAALTGMRNNGGHAMRKLVGNLIPNSGRFADRLLVFKEIAGGILRNPEHVALWRTGADQGIGYLGTVGGKKVLVVVASEGPWAGKVISTIFPDANQLAIFLAR